MTRKTSKAETGKTIGVKHNVGRGNPPLHTRFAKGKSGNPKGRPKGRRNLSSIMMDAARDQVTATIAGRQRRISKLQATAMQLATKAAGGDPTSTARFLDWMDEIEARAAAAKPEEFPLSEIDLAVIREIYRRMQLCAPPEQTAL
jgi:Family of unknown function (DUF5681)